MPFNARSSIVKKSRTITSAVLVTTSADLGVVAGMGGAPSRPQDIVRDWNPNRGHSGQTSNPYQGESYQMSGHGPSYARAGEQFGYYSTRNDSASASASQGRPVDYYDKGTQTSSSGNRRHSY
jgi:hypothetical protein